MGPGAETDTTVRPGREVTAVAAFAVEADEPAATRALAYPVPEVGGVHVFNVGAPSCVRRDPC
jgi:hypothetical protein